MNFMCGFWCQLDALYITWRGCMPVEYCVELICIEHLTIPITVWFTSLIGIWWRGRWRKGRERESETMHVHECGCGWWFTKTEMVWIWLIGLCYLYHVLWKPCHSWLDIFILNLTFMVQSMLEGGGRSWELGECMVLEISYDIHLRVKDQFCWLDRISGTLPAAYLQNQCCSFDQSCYFV